MLNLLLRIGLVTRRDDGTIRWPLYLGPAWKWRMALRRPATLWQITGGVYLFRNLPGVVKWREGRLLPVRWGIGFMGLVEFGDRG